MRMIDTNYEDHPDNKASHCAKMIAEYYQKYDAQKGTQFVQCALYGGAAFIQHFRYLCYGVDNVCPSLAVLPAVLLRKGGTV